MLSAASAQLCAQDARVLPNVGLPQCAMERVRGRAGGMSRGAEARRTTARRTVPPLGQPPRPRRASATLQHYRCSTKQPPTQLRPQIVHASSPSLQSPSDPGETLPPVPCHLSVLSGAQPSPRPSLCPSAAPAIPALGAVSRSSITFQRARIGPHATTQAPAVPAVPSRHPTRYRRPSPRPHPSRAAACRRRPRQTRSPGPAPRPTS